MFLSAYHFDGDRDRLLGAYDQLRKSYPSDQSDLHICVERDDGITVYDACPTRAEFDAFSTGAEFTAALSSVGLPIPRVEPLGEVHTTTRSLVR